MAPVSKSSKKAPKTKGAPRAKSGCYTCRIRRKKCDEVKNDKGQCGTCVRLKLECLGYGDKRPDHLKDTTVVTSMREKIKGFLASQGMIKGHSARGARKDEQEYLVLHYADDCSSDSSTSPPTPTLTIPDDNQSHLTMSNIRGERWFPPPYDTAQTTQELSPDSSYGSTSVSFGGSVMLASVPLNSSSTSIVSPSWQPDTSITPSRASTSLIAASYNVNYPQLYEDQLTPADLTTMTSLSSFYVPTSRDQDLLIHYRRDVIGLQYLLADLDVHELMFQTSQSDSYVFNAVCLLADIHQAQRNGVRDPNDDHRSRYSMITPVLHNRDGMTTDHAIAALHTVSTFLFIGGNGPWYLWLKVVYDFTDRHLRQSGMSISQAIMLCDEKMCFILKTAIWFDVIASVTLGRPPHFLPEIRELFDPTSAYIDGSSSCLDPRMSMMSVMGCENHIVWAMAEVSCLAHWKQQQKIKGCLSTMELARRGMDIENHLMPRHGPEEVFADDIRTQRRYASEIFRASTRVYLHSVLSGDNPGVPEIGAGVQDTISCLQRVPTMDLHTQETTRSVVRSVVLSIFMCGCLTDNEWQRGYFSRRLEEQGGETVGNCYMVRKLMQSVWSERVPGQPVRWREALRRTGLLLV